VAKNATFNEAEAAECAGALAEIADRGRLAALGMAQPVLVARRAQLEREQLRIRTRKGGDDRRLGLLDRSIALAVGRINEVEVATEVLRVDTPTAPEAGGVIFGRVTEKGIGRRDLVVSALDPGGKVTGFGCSGPSGAFKLTAAKGERLRLRVTDKDGATLWGDPQAFDLADGDVIRREIDLTTSGPACPQPDDEPGGPSKTVKVPELIGSTEAEAVRLLRAAGLSPGKRTVEEAPDQVGRVIGQSPQAGAEAERGAPVDFVVGSEPRTTMPDLKGLPLEAALAKIEELGLNALEPTFAPSSDFEGRVIQHTPSAGEPVRQGDPVVLLVGSAPRVTMPDLRGLKVEEAQRRLKEMDLAANEPALVPDAQHVGLVIRHTPQPGASVSPGTTVTLFVGRKPEEEPGRITMPDLRGMPLEKAHETLGALDLKAEKPTLEPDPDRVDRVIRHKPAAGAVVQPGATVALVVGAKAESPPASPTMPNVVGRPIDEALKVLEEIKLEPAETTFVDDARRAGQVVRQSPPEGSVVSPDVAIRLVVAKGNDRRDMRTAIALAARDPAVAALDLSAEDMTRQLEASGVTSLDGLAEVAKNDARTRKTFGLRRAADSRRLRTVLTAAMSGIR
jgi:beta-lactam-binding protein with PASTA domain